MSLNQILDQRLHQKSWTNHLIYQRLMRTAGSKLGRRRPLKDTAAAKFAQLLFETDLAMAKIRQLHPKHPQTGRREGGGNGPWDL
jgi:hypothetical protein